MADDPKTNEEKGKTLLTAVERLVAKSDSIREMVAVCATKAKAKEAGKKNPDTLRELTAAEIVRAYSNRTAIAGGASSLPALLPGIGSIIAGTAGAFAELAYLLKSEVEMCLALAHLYGFDIEDPRERQLAFLMASVGTYDASGGSFFGDVVKAEGVAIWNYAPRAGGRLVLQAMTSLALMYIWRGFFKVIPVLGIVIGSSVNKLLTHRVGERAAKDLRTRRELVRSEARATPAVKKKTAKKKAKRQAPLKVVGEER